MQHKKVMIGTLRAIEWKETVSSKLSLYWDAGTKN